MTAQLGRCISHTDGVGYLREWLPGKVDPSMLCQEPNCKRLLEDGISFNECHHVICHGHVAAAEMFVCPVCEWEIENQYDDAAAVDDAIDELPVLDHTPLVDYQPAKTAERVNSSTVPCPLGCAAELTLNTVKSHFSECDYRMIKCIQCSKILTFRDWVRVDHDNTCIAMDWEPNVGHISEQATPAEEQCPAGCDIEPGETVSEHMARPELIDMHKNAMKNMIDGILDPLSQVGDDSEEINKDGSVGGVFVHALLKIQKLNQKREKAEEARTELLNKIISAQNPDGTINMQIFQSIISPDPDN